MAVESCGDFNALPEDCISNALSLTSPKDACRLSVVASPFRSAAESDAVWERFLPFDYRDIISRSGEGSVLLLSKFETKKDLYLYLCDNPILIDGGRKNFSLEKWSGKKCYTLSARDLHIVWGDTDQYWQWTSLKKSRFSEVAELKDVCWFEIRGKINTSMLSPCTNYVAYLVFTSKSRIHGFEHILCEASIGISGHEGKKSNVCLDLEREWRQISQTVPTRISWWFPSTRRGQQNAHMDSNSQYPKKRDDRWMEVELGEFFVEGSENNDLEISLMEVKGGNWKSGIIIEGIEIRPKGV